MTIKKIFDILSPEVSEEANTNAEILQTLKEIKMALAPGMNEDDDEANEERDPVQDEINKEKDSD